MTTAFFAEVTPKRGGLLAMLSDGQWHDQHACTEAGGMRFGARIRELREAGYQIETQRLGPRRFFYRLVMPEQGRLF